MAKPTKSKMSIFSFSLAYFGGHFLLPAAVKVKQIPEFGHHFLGCENASIVLLCDFMSIFSTKISCGQVGIALFKAA